MASTASGHATVETVRADTVTPDDEATAEAWEAAERVAVAAARKAEERRAFETDAEVYGVHVRATSTRKDTWRVTIVRVTRTRFIDSLGGHWIRQFGKRVSVSRFYTERLTDEAIAEIERRCGGASTFDFIKAGKALAPLKLEAP